MNLLEACLKGKELEAANAVKELVGRAQPSALWAIIMNAASWHEQRTFDTPHSTILTYSIHRMIENLGHHPEILSEKPSATALDIPVELKEIIQFALLERLVRNLAAVEHWDPQKGPRYDIRTEMDSLDNAVNRYEQAIRERNHRNAHKAAADLVRKDTPIRLQRMTCTLSAEDPDGLGHAFIMPMSLLTELPSSKFTRPLQGSLWHLTEYLVRKVPSKRPDSFPSDDDLTVEAEASDISHAKDLVATSTIEYGILGHNAIFAQRIAEAGRRGLLNKETIGWLLKKLEENIGISAMHEDDLNIAAILKGKSGTDWAKKPSEIITPNAGQVRAWFEDNRFDYWSAMMDLKSSTFEQQVQNIKAEEWPLIQSAQYAMASINGAPGASHVIIYTHSVWDLVEKDLIEPELAALQVHRMLREYLEGR
ncbi:hypothetical protein EU537_08995 [Candidatus Thorarchaeota archaeon]|nr:MAG: hypothetical protein EU537_08995 [Candidatus Thorarchaeota archaeon]